MVHQEYETKHTDAVPVGISSAATGSNVISQIILAEGTVLCYANWSQRAEL